MITLNEIKKLLYKEKPIANYRGADETYSYYTTDLPVEGKYKELNFKVPHSENEDFDNEIPAQLLIRWIEYPETAIDEAMQRIAKQQGIEPWQERVIEERDELSSRLEKLSNYIDANEHFSTLDNDNKGMLIAQRMAMGNYLDILNRRIDKF